VIHNDTLARFAETRAENKVNLVQLTCGMLGTTPQASYWHAVSNVVAWALSRDTGEVDDRSPAEADRAQRR
jgi:hypothetical protein